MSNADFQKGLVRLFRDPVGVSFADLDLSATEERNLKFALEDRRAKKFGIGMEAIRMEITFSGLPMARVLIGQERLTRIYRESFSAQSGVVRGYHLGYVFAGFLLRVLEASEPKWVLDCLAYERDLVFLRAFELPVSRPSGSMELPHFVRHGRWLVSSYATNVVELAQLAMRKDKRPERESLQLAVAHGERTILLLAAGEQIRHFDVSREFQAAVLAMEVGQSLPGKDVWDALCSVGIVEQAVASSLSVAQI